MVLCSDGINGFIFLGMITFKFYMKIDTSMVYEHQCRFCKKIDFFFNFKFVMHSASPLLMSFIIFDSHFHCLFQKENPVRKICDGGK